MPDPLHPAPGMRMAIVGGCGGIGQALVAAALALDLRVTVLDLPASLEQAPPATGVAARPIDVTDGDAVAAAFAGLSGLDALVNLGGLHRGGDPCRGAGIRTME